MDLPAQALASVAPDGTIYHDESRGLKLAGLALMALSAPGFAWLAERVQDGALFAAAPVELATLVLVLSLAVNLLTIGLLMLAFGLGRRNAWREAKRRRAALVKLAGANLLLPVVAFSLLQDNPVLQDVDDDALWWIAPLAVLMFVLIGRGVSVLRRGWRHEAASADEALRDDPREPVLYLRAFADDGQMMMERDAIGIARMIGNHIVAASPEQELAIILRRVGPVLAIGKPGEVLPELGAARLYVAHDQWQQTVLTLMARASLVVLRIGASTGIQWEIEQTLTQVPRERVVLLLLGEGETMALAARQLAQQLGVDIPMPVPTTGWRRVATALMTDPRKHLGAVVCFDANGAAHVEPVRRLPRRGADLALAMLTMRPATAPLRDVFRRVFAHQGRAWFEPRRRAAAVALALLLGGLGAHWFYLGERRRALAYALGFIFFVPVLLAYRDAVRWLLMDRRGFDQRFGGTR